MTITAFGQKINYRYLVHTRRFALLGAGLVTFTLGVVGFLIVPQISTALDQYSQLQKQEDLISQLEVKSQQLLQLPQSQLFASSTQINSVMPSRKPLLELLSALNEVAGKAGVRYSDLSLSPGKVASEGAQLAVVRTGATNSAGAGTTGTSGTSAGVTSRTSNRPAQSSGVSSGTSGSEALAVSLKATGTLANINIFLREIERVAPLTTVTKLSLIERTGTRVDPDSAFEADLEIQTYFFTKSVSATLTSPIPQITINQQTIMNELASYLYPSVISQDMIRGGGLEDLFGIEQLEIISQ